MAHPECFRHRAHWERAFRKLNPDPRFNKIHEAIKMDGNKGSSFECKPRIRIVKGETIALGPGKVDLLEAVERAGSISQAARLMNLSYRRAWDMVHMMNRNFKSPLVSGAAGGKGGGGAQLTEEGKSAVCLYRKMEKKALETIEKEWRDLQKLLNDAEFEQSGNKGSGKK